MSRRASTGSSGGGLELTPYHRIAWDGAKIETFFVDLFLEARTSLRHGGSFSTSTSPTIGCTDTKRALLSRLL
jgi:hypothetical protein